MITVFTPTYNRKNQIIILYKSLQNQTYTNFEWLIVDDGSTDGTINEIQKYMKEKKIKIRLFCQKNSGKHVAFNKGIKEAKGELFICVDSDDYLTADAMYWINHIDEKYRDNLLICGYVFLKGYTSEKPVTDYYSNYESIENYNDYIINKGFKGDKCEVFRTNILKQYQFPIFDKEKFLAEGFLYSHIGRKYQYVFVNEIIYLCEYLSNGLTKSGRKLRINNPQGGMAHAQEYLDPKYYLLKIRIKNYLLYYTYARFYKKRDTSYRILKRKSFLSKICYQASLIIYIYWDRKYGA